MKIKLSICFLWLLRLTSGAYAQSNSALPPDIQRIRDRGKLIVAMYDHDMAPFFMHDKDGGFIGYDVDLAQAMAKSLGVKVEFNRQAKAFDDVIGLVERRQADIGISKLSKTSDRAQRVLFSNTYTTILQVLLVHRLNKARLKRGDDPYKAFNYPDVKIGVAAGTSYVGFAQRDFFNAQVTAYENRNTALEALLHGDLHGMLVDESTVKNWFHENPEAGIKIQTVVRKDRIDPKAIAINAHDVHLRTWINTFLELNQLDGSTDKLQSFYLNNDAWRNKTK